MGKYHGRRGNLPTVVPLAIVLCISLFTLTDHRNGIFRPRGPYNHIIHLILYNEPLFTLSTYPLADAASSGVSPKDLRGV